MLHSSTLSALPEHNWIKVNSLEANYISESFATLINATNPIAGGGGRYPVPHIHKRLEGSFSLIWTPSFASDTQVGKLLMNLQDSDAFAQHRPQTVNKMSSFISRRCFEKDEKRKI